MTDSFSRELMISVSGHIVLALLIFVQALVMPNEPINIRNAIRVDVVGLPKKMEALPEKAPTPAPEPKPEVAKVTPPEPFPKPAPVVATKSPAPKVNVEKAEKNAMRKLKALEAMEKFKQEMNTAKSATTKPKADLVAGNKLADGNSLTGLDKIDYDHYFDEIETKVHSAWSIPQWLADSDYKASVQVLIDERGYVIKKIFRKTSGNEIFDAKVAEAIDSSSPLPPPPQKLRAILSTSGIVFNFPQ